MIVYGAIGALLDSNDENNAKRTELLNFNVQQIIDSNDIREKQNSLLEKEITILERQIALNELKIESIGTKWIGEEDPKVLILRKENEKLEKEIDAFNDKKIGGFAITSKMKIAIANIQNWVKNVSEGIFTTVSIFLLKIVIFPFITYIIAYNFARVVIGNNTVDLMKKSFKKKDKYDYID